MAMKLGDWVNEVTITESEGYKIFSGKFAASAGDFEIKYQADGGNSDTYEVTLSGCQYSLVNNEPMKFTITGCWEINEVISMFRLLGEVM